MTTVRAPAELVISLRDRVAAEMRPATQVNVFAPDDPTQCELVWNPDLSAADQSTADAILRSLLSEEPMTTQQYKDVRAQVQVLRDLRQLGRNAFMALPAADRDRMLYDALVAQTIIDLALLRD